MSATLPQQTGVAKPITEMVRIDGTTLPVEQGSFTLTEEDFLLYGMLLDPVFMPELMWKDPKNFSYGGQYRVRDYQYIINRLDDPYAIVSCARSVGKTESEKVHAEIHPLESYDKMLITAPELIHLLPLTDTVEDNIHDNQLLSQFLDLRNGQTGFQHRPFQANFIDGTKIVGRIPKVTGTGVHGQHQDKLIVEEGQDYPERAWTELNEAQPDDAPVLTPFGYMPMGALEPGDQVIGQNGHPTRVLGIAERGNRQVCTVRFSDGALVECDEDHVWTVTCNRHAGRWRNRRTHEIEKDLARGAGFGSLKQPWFVPHNEPVLFVSEELYFDPYLLGLLLGDGGLKHGSVIFSTADEELVDEVRSRIHPDEELVHAGRYDYRVRRRVHGSRWRLVPTKAALTKLGLWGLGAAEKYVPREYLFATDEQRLELLKGLVDSDGHVSENGAVSFSSCSERLRDDVAHLVRSLGGRLKRREQKDKRGYRTQYVVRFRLPYYIPARLARKARASTVTSDSMRRHIVAIERGGMKRMRCIKVEAEDGLYLTADMVVTHNTVNYDARDRHGNKSFRFWVYGVHSGNKSSGFDERARSPVWRKVKVTALRRPDWDRERKQNAIAAYGGTSSPDYKRNILGEPGAGTTAYFVVARVMACVDQDVTRGEKVGSDYNENQYVKQIFRAEEFEDLGMNIADQLDLPDIKTGGWWCGVDIGLTDSPTVITLFAEWEHKKKQRIALLRRYMLERFRPRHIREALYAITWHLGTDLLGVGIDVTGLGKPIFQDMEDDELCPQRLRNIAVGYTFNSKIEIGVAHDLVTEANGVLRDHLGNMVKVLEDELTGEKTYVVMVPFISASTGMIADEVNSGALLLPFDTDVTSDMLQETKQRVDRVGKRGESGGSTAKKGDRFHILDSFRAALYRRRQDEIIAKLAVPEQQDVLDLAGLADGPGEHVTTPEVMRHLLGLEG